MIDVDKWQEIFESINRHRLRTALTAFGVAWGIFMLTILLGASQGLQNGIEHSFQDDAVNSIWLSPGRTSMAHDGLKEGRQVRFDNSDYDFLKEEFKDIDDISGRFFLSGDRIVTYQDKSLAFRIYSVHPGHQTIENSIMVEGRYLTDRDLDELRKVAVIGTQVKKDLFGDEEDVLGKEIKIDDAVFKVIGVFTDTGGERMKRFIYVPITTTQKIYTANNRIHQVIFTGGDLPVEEMEQLEEKVVHAMARRKHFDPDDRRAMRTFNLAKEYESFMQLMTAIKGIMWLVGIFSIIAGVIGVSNIMLIIVKDRTKEIGIRKAIGATPRSIVMMIFQEAIFITAIAGYGGLALGVGVMALLGGVETEFFRNPEIHIGLAIAATMVLIAAGALAGFLPAMKAARINPVMAIKSE